MEPCEASLGNDVVGEPLPYPISQIMSKMRKDIALIKEELLLLHQELSNRNTTVVYS